MRFSKVKVYHFRNLVDAEIEVKAKTIILIGENGQGKTNFLEALYMLCFGSSFRTKRDREIINMQQEEMSLYAELTGEDEEQATVLFKNLKEKKEILLNGKRIVDRKELLENVPCVLFSHEDMTFLLGGPEKRRLFLNQTMTLCRPESLETLRQYQKILRMRNICLKNGTKELTAVYNEQLA
ncbi:MAG: DNA replication/repair protein RecF, partial [Spirochaetales bacterium]